MGDKLLSTEVEEDFHAVMEGIKHEEEIKEAENYQDRTIVQALKSSPDYEPLSLLCRLCATKAKDMVYMFGQNELDKNLIEKIEQCLPIVVKSTDRLPKHACQMCLAKLELCFQFHKAVAEAEKQLLMFDQQQLSVFDQQQVLIFDQQTPSIIVEGREFSQTSSLCNDQQDIVLISDGNEVELKIPSEENMDNNESTTDSEELEILEPSVENDVIVSNLMSKSKGLSASEKSQTNNRKKKNITSSKGDLNKSADLSKNCLNSGQISESHIEQSTGEKSEKKKKSDSIRNSHEIIRSEKELLISDQQTANVVEEEKDCCGDVNNEKSIAIDEELEITFESVKKKVIRTKSKPRPKEIPSPKISIIINLDADNEGTNLEEDNRETNLEKDNKETKSVDTGDLGTDLSTDVVESVPEIETELESVEKSSKSDEKSSKSDEKSSKSVEKSSKSVEKSSKSIEKLSKSAEKLSKSVFYVPPITRSRRVNNKKALEIEDTVKNVESENLQSKSATYKCKECKEKFATEVRLNFHKLHHEYIAKLSSSKNNDEVTNQETTLNEDENGLTENKENKKSASRLSRKIFKTQEELYDYEMQNERNFDCSYCKRTFSSAYALKVHKKKNYCNPPRSKKTHACTHCEKAFARRQNLKTHVRRKHTGELPFSCDLCDEKFVTTTKRAVHRRIHTGECPFKCTLCEKTFAWAYSLRLHMFSHTGERPHSCPLCNKAFRRLDAKRRHMVTHTEEKQHECELCSSRFSEAFKLRRHKKAVHGIVVNRKSTS